MGGKKDQEPKCEIKWVKPEDLRPHPLNEKLYGCMSSAKDLDALRTSIKEHGILTPLKATTDGEIISGHRRRFLAEKLGLPTVPVEYVQVEDPLEVEALVIAANDQRQKTLEAGIREFMRLKLIEAERGKQRQVQAPKRRGKTVRQETAGEDEVQENFPEDKGQSRDLAAKRLGISGKSADKAKDVVEAIDKAEADGDPERANLLREKLTKSIDAAYREVKGKPRKPRAVKPKAEEGKTQSKEAVTGRGVDPSEPGGMTDPGQESGDGNGPASEDPTDSNANAPDVTTKPQTNMPNSDGQEVGSQESGAETTQTTEPSLKSLDRAQLGGLTDLWGEYLDQLWTKTSVSVKRSFIFWLTERQ